MCFEFGQRKYNSLFAQCGLFIRIYVSQWLGCYECTDINRTRNIPETLRKK